MLFPDTVKANPRGLVDANRLWQSRKISATMPTQTRKLQSTKARRTLVTRMSSNRAADQQPLGQHPWLWAVSFQPRSNLN